MTDEEVLAHELINTIKSRTSPRAVLLEDRIEKALAYLDKVATPNLHTLTHASRCLLGEYDDLALDSPAALLRDLFEQRWVCRVVSTGFHNGVKCHPGEPHGADWRCGHYWVAAPLTEKQAREYGLLVDTPETPEEPDPGESVPPTYTAHPPH